MTSFFELFQICSLYTSTIIKIITVKDKYENNHEQEVNNFQMDMILSFNYIEYSIIIYIHINTPIYFLKLNKLIRFMTITLFINNVTYN